MISCAHIHTAQGVKDGRWESVSCWIAIGWDWDLNWGLGLRSVGEVTGGGEDDS